MGCLVGIDFGIKRSGLAYTDPNKQPITIFYKYTFFQSDLLYFNQSEFFTFEKN